MSKPLGLVDNRRQVGYDWGKAACGTSKRVTPPSLEIRGHQSLIGEQPRGQSRSGDGSSVLCSLGDIPIPSAEKRCRRKQKLHFRKDGFACYDPSKLFQRQHMHVLTMLSETFPKYDVS